MGLLDGLYRVLMRRNSVYVTFVVAGAFFGERVVDNGVHKLWDYCNVGMIICECTEDLRMSHEAEMLKVVSKGQQRVGKTYDSME
ncbi:hypothetical protein COCNU_scaffold004131G000010 [Cocos nucifera]|nr:hypothetical protein [Cocos nucifera]